MVDSLRLVRTNYPLSCDRQKMEYEISSLEHFTDAAEFSVRNGNYWLVQKTSLKAMQTNMIALIGCGIKMKQIQFWNLNNHETANVSV